MAMRYFNLINPDTGDVFGRYSGDKPKQAASKAFTKYLQSRNAKEQIQPNTLIILRECTKGSSKEVYHFQASREKLNEPEKIVITDKESGKQKIISYHYRNKITEMKDADIPKKEEIEEKLDVKPSIIKLPENMDI